MYGQNGDCFFFSCDRPQINGAVVPGPENNFIFPRGVWLAAATSVAVAWQIGFSREQAAYNKNRA
jgi:hypothetical protein